MADLDVRDFPDRELTGHGYGNNDFGALTRSKKLLRLLQTVARPIFSSARGGGLEPDFRVLFSAIFHTFAEENCRWRRKQWNLAEAKL